MQISGSGWGKVAVNPSLEVDTILSLVDFGDVYRHFWSSNLGARGGVKERSLVISSG